MAAQRGPGASESSLALQTDRNAVPGLGGNVCGLRNMTKDAFKQTEARWSDRLRRTALWVLFALVLFIPKTLNLRKRPGLWNLLRFGVAVIGVFLFAMQGGSAGVYLFGLLLILLALISPCL